MTQPSECDDDGVEDDATGGGAAPACSFASASASSRIGWAGEVRTWLGQ